MDIENLQPADVLLYSSQTWLGKLIRAIDGTEITHAGIYLGDNQVGEALMVDRMGVNANPVCDSFKGTNWVEVRRLDNIRGPHRPVLEVAKQYLEQGNRYAYAEILLVGVVCLTRKWNLQDRLLGRIAIETMNRANQFIEDMLDQGREPMICSEFVFRCYDEADEADDDLYTIDISSPNSHVPVRRFSPFRRWKGMRQFRASDDLPTVHPESLMGKVLRESQGSKLQKPFGSAKVTPSAPMSDEELNEAIQSYLGEAKEMKMQAKQELAFVTTDTLKTTAANLASSLAKAAPVKFGKRAETLSTEADLAAATVADFVTPGDLWRSPSLTKAGRINGYT